jgi:hypothetical protein
VFVGVLFGGPPRFTGPRWVPGAQPQPPARLNTLAPTQSPQPPVQTGTGSSVLAPVILTIVVIVAAAVILWFVLRALLKNRVRNTLPDLGAVEPVPAELPADPHAEDEAAPAAPVVHRGLRLALEALDEQREPADAVVRAWLGLQSAAEDSGVERRAAETPTEFTSRVITRVQADAAAAAQLVEVYQGVRFGGHPITPADVRAARAAIEKLLDSWHEPILRARR